MLTSDSHTFCPYLASHRGRDISAMTHNHFYLLCFLLSECKERYFWHFLPTDLKMLGVCFLLIFPESMVSEWYLPRNTVEYNS